MISPVTLKRWIARLRSGQEKQGRTQLCILNSRGQMTYCCMGVLGKLRGLPDTRMRDRALLSDIAGMETVLSANVSDTLARLNDDEKWSFRQIADLLERVTLRQIDETDQASLLTLYRAMPKKRTGVTHGITRHQK
jgi:hypothetical protein